MQNFISFLMALIFFENFENFSLGIIRSLSKMSLQGTIVTGRLRSELCSWGVNQFPQDTLGSQYFVDDVE